MTYLCKKCFRQELYCRCIDPVFKHKDILFINSRKYTHKKFIKIYNNYKLLNYIKDIIKLIK